MWRLAAPPTRSLAVLALAVLALAALALAALALAALASGCAFDPGVVGPTPDGAVGQDGLDAPAGEGGSDVPVDEPPADTCQPLPRCPPTACGPTDNGCGTLVDCGPCPDGGGLDLAPVDAPPADVPVDPPKPDVPPDVLTGPITVGANSADTLRVMVRDTTLVEAEDTSNAGEPLLEVQRNERTALIRFDLSALEGRTISAASLVLEVVNSDNDTVLIHRLLVPWDDSATWMRARGASNWSPPGCAGPGSCRQDPASAAFDLNDMTGRIEVPLPTKLVQALIDDPDRNHGLLLVIAMGNGGLVQIVSSEGTDGQRPFLRLTLD